jgi:hypothetical protein
LKISDKVCDCTFAIIQVAFQFQWDIDSQVLKNKAQITKVLGDECYKTICTDKFVIAMRLLAYPRPKTSRVLLDAPRNSQNVFEPHFCSSTWHFC